VEQRVADLEKAQVQARQELQQREQQIARQNEELEQRRLTLQKPSPQQAALHQQLAAMTQELQLLRRKAAEGGAATPNSGNEQRLKQELQRQQEELTRNRQEVQQRRQEITEEMKLREHLRRKLVLVNRQLDRLRAQMLRRG
jgi:hypothetical protein